MENFKKGSEVILKGGEKATVVRTIGNGGQGVVYEVLYRNKPYALKWYLREYLKNIDQKEFYNNLCDNQAAGAPSKDFLWPIAVSEYTENSFGYLMPLRPKGYSDFSSILNAKKRFASVRVQISAAKNICKAFQALHSQGYSYQDINNGNFFINVATGDILVCDNDNVAPCGTWMGMAGKDRYMAPEIVLRKKHAGMESDLYSLAIVLFMIFFVAHPLEGRAVHACPCLTAKYMRYFYAEHPVFVYDPADASNRPVAGIDNNVIRLWSCYPKSLRALFERAFTKGLFEEGYRVRENEWIDCFNEMEGLLVTCPLCGGEQFYSPMNDGKSEFVCEDCKRKIRKPFLLQGKKRCKVLYPGTVLKYSDIAYTDDDSVCGVVIESKRHPGLWGLRIKDGMRWEAKYTNGTVKKQEKVIPLLRNTELTIQDQNMQIII